MTAAWPWFGLLQPVWRLRTVYEHNRKLPAVLGHAVGALGPFSTRAALFHMVSLGYLLGNSSARYEPLRRLRGAGLEVLSRKALLLIFPVGFGEGMTKAASRNWEWHCRTLISVLRRCWWGFSFRALTFRAFNGSCSTSVQFTAFTTREVSSISLPRPCWTPICMTVNG